MTTILITGGAGFIGSNIVEEMLNQDYNVKILDNFVTGKDDNLKDFKNRVEVIKGDIRNFKTVKQAVKDVDYISHHAALISVTESVENPVHVSKVNILGTLNTLVAARDSGVKRIVYASSSAVYGGIEGFPSKEAMGVSAISPYGLTKISNEQFFKMFYDIYELESIGLRYFNVFGPGQYSGSDYSAVIPKFINSMLNDKKPVIYGDGEQTRDFIFVKDVAMANVISLKVNKAKGNAYNIAYGGGISINDLVNNINEILGKNIESVYENARPGDPKHSEADISEAIKKLGFRPKYDFKDGLKLTIDWFRRKG